MTPEKQALVGWWRNHNKNVVCVKDRSLGYAFYLVVSVFPFGTSNQMPSLQSWIQFMEKEAFFKAITKQFGFVMMLAYGSVMNLPVAQYNNELIKYMKNISHFDTALNRKNKKVSMSTGSGASLLDLAIKLSFLIDTNRVFGKSEEMVTSAKTFVEKLNKNESLAKDKDYVTAISFTFFDKDIWKTAVVLGLDALVFVNCIAFFTGRGKLAIDMDPVKKHKDADGIITYRYYDLRGEESDDEVNAEMWKKLSGSLRTHLDEIGKGLFTKLNYAFTEVYSTFEGFGESTSGTGAKEPPKDFENEELDEDEKIGSSHTPPTDGTQKEQEPIEPPPETLANTSQNLANAKGFAFDPDDLFAENGDLKVIQEARNIWSASVKTLAKEVKQIGADPLDSDVDSDDEKSDGLFPWDGPKEAKKKVKTEGTEGTEGTSDKQGSERDEDEESDESFRASTIESKDDEEESYDDDFIDYISGDSRAGTKKNEVVIDMMDSSSSSSDSSSDGKNYLFLSILLLIDSHCLYSDDDKESKKRAAVHTPKRRNVKPRTKK